MATNKVHAHADAAAAATAADDDDEEEEDDNVRRIQEKCWTLEQFPLFGCPQRCLLNHVFIYLGRYPLLGHRVIYPTIFADGRGLFSETLFIVHDQWRNSWTSIVV